MDEFEFESSADRSDHKLIVDRLFRIGTETFAHNNNSRRHMPIRFESNIQHPNLYETHKSLYLMPINFIDLIIVNHIRIKLQCG